MSNNPIMEANASTSIAYSKVYLFALDLTSLKVYGNDLSVNYTNSTDAAFPGGTVLPMTIEAFDVVGKNIGSCTVQDSTGTAVIDNGATATRLTVSFAATRLEILNAFSVPFFQGVWIGNYTVGINNVAQNGESLTVEYFNNNEIEALILAFDSNHQPLGSAPANDSQGIALLQLPNSGNPAYLFFSSADEQSPFLMASEV